jgi:hypothetical protein
MDEKIAQLCIGNVNGHILSDRSGNQVHLLPQICKLGISKRLLNSADGSLVETVCNLGPM